VSVPTAPDAPPPLSWQMQAILDAWSPPPLPSSPENQKAGETERGAEFGTRTYARLNEQAALNHAKGEARRAMIERIMAEHTGPERLTAKLIQQKLGGDPPPSIRTIQDHMKIINARSSASR
jgi:hypothetical protein